MLLLVLGFAVHKDNDDIRLSVIVAIAGTTYWAFPEYELRIKLNEGDCMWFDPTALHASENSPNDDEEKICISFYLNRKQIEGCNRTASHL